MPGAALAQFPWRVGVVLATTSAWLAVCATDRTLAAIIDADPDFERLAPTPLSTVCFRYRPGAGESGDGADLAPVDDDPHAEPNERLMAAVNAEVDAGRREAALQLLD